MLLADEKLVCPNQGPQLPSSRSALAFVRGEDGSTLAVIGHTLGRAALIGVGLGIAGERKHLVQKSLMAAMAIESFVLLWTYHAENSTQKKTGPSDDVVTGINPNYIVKYNAQALQLAALPSPQGPVMLCSYIPFAQLESTDPTSGYNDFQKLRTKYETAPENMYGKMGRTHIARLVKRYFDPSTFKELPSDILYESDQKFPIPTSPDLGVPCG